jgi:hypothetical protein
MPSPAVEGAECPFRDALLAATEREIRFLRDAHALAARDEAERSLTRGVPAPAWARRALRKKGLA